MHRSKVCFKCGIEKPLGEFYPHKMMGDGHLGKCKECSKKDSTEHRLKNIDYVRAYDRARGRTPERLESNSRRRQGITTRVPKKNCVSSVQARKKWLERNSDKRAAHIILGNAVRGGKVVKKPCEKCGATNRIHGHHEDYTKPLDVIWLCQKHHAEIHRKYK